MIFVLVYSVPHFFEIGMAVIYLGYLRLIVAVPLEWLEKRELFGPAKALLAVGVIAGVYCILAGIHMAGGWEAPPPGGAVWVSSSPSVCGPTY